MKQIISEMKKALINRISFIKDSDQPFVYNRNKLQNKCFARYAFLLIEKETSNIHYVFHDNVKMSLMKMNSNSFFNEAFQKGDVSPEKPWIIPNKKIFDEMISMSKKVIDPKLWMVKNDILLQARLSDDHTQILESVHKCMSVMDPSIQFVINSLIENAKMNQSYFFPEKHDLVLDLIMDPGFNRNESEYILLQFFKEIK